jgi:transcriptional regulator with XRE-family HTH domain
MTRIGDKLKELRGSLSLFDVEKGTGITRTRISEYEKGKYLPTIPTLRKMADFLEVPWKELCFLYLEDLYTDPEQRSVVLEWAKSHPESFDENWFIQRFKSLPQEKQGELLAKLQTILKQGEG